LDALPAWSPDGERIAFATDRDGNWELYVMEADGAAQRRLTNTQEDESSPAWSTGEIYVMNSDASGLTRLTDNPADDSFPAWRP
jgi:Tol biopolymer transport system component